MRKTHLFIVIVILALMAACSSMRTNVAFFEPIQLHLKQADYDQAIALVDQGREQNEYTKKDRALYYLDKGALLYYQGNYKESIEHLNQAEQAMEELFTQSISKAAASLLLNDNALPYYGEIYEMLYVNIFQALNYLNLNNIDGVYVEARQINIKLRELEDKYEQMVSDMNQSEDSKVKVETPKIKFHDDVLAHYLSYLAFRMTGELDNSRISLVNIKEAWSNHKNLYTHQPPEFLQHEFKTMSSNMLKWERGIKDTRLACLVFTGQAPQKEATGGSITTYKNMIGISVLGNPLPNATFPFPGMEEGYHFKFSLPVLKNQGSQVGSVRILVDGNPIGELDLLEDMGSIAQYTFQTRRDIIYFKTITRTVVKGLAAAEAKKQLKKEAGVAEGSILGMLMDATVDIGVDATENADLRYWRTMPNLCFAGEFKMNPGEHSIVLEFYNKNNMILKRMQWDNYTISDGVNVLDTALLL